MTEQEQTIENASQSAPEGGHRRRNAIASSLCLLLMLLAVGAVVSFALVFRTFSRTVRDNFRLTVVMSDSASDADAAAVEKQIDALDFARTVDYRSREGRAMVLRESGELAPDSFVAANPLPAFIETVVKRGSLSEKELERVAAELRKDARVADVVYAPDMLRIVSTYLPLVGWVLLAFVVVQALIALFVLRHSSRRAGSALPQAAVSSGAVGPTLGIGVMACLILFGVLHYYSGRNAQMAELIPWTTKLIGCVAIMTLALLIALLASRRQK